MVVVGSFLRFTIIRLGAMDSFSDIRSSHMSGNRFVQSQAGHRFFFSVHNKTDDHEGHWVELRTLDLHMCGSSNKILSELSHISGHLGELFIMEIHTYRSCGHLISE